MKYIDEAFCYLWFDSKNRKFYLGYHGGHPDDDYTHSSTVMESFTKKTIPSYIHRRILATGTQQEMKELETKLLENRKRCPRRWDKYHNVVTCFPPPLCGEDNSNWKGGLATYNPSEYMRKWREKNPEKMRESWRKYREKNPEKIREQNRKYCAENPEYHRKYRQENAEQIRERNRKYYAKKKAENPEQIRESYRKWREKNPEKMREYKRKYRAKKKAEKLANMPTLEDFFG